VIAYARIGVLPNWLFYPGEVLLIVGAAFTLWSYALLGRDLSAHVQVLPEHKVIESGPYRYIRHPGYLGQMVAFIGLGWPCSRGFPLWQFSSLRAVCLPTEFATKKSLAAELRDTYVNYMKRTKRFLPFVW